MLYISWNWSMHLPSIRANLGHCHRDVGDCFATCAILQEQSPLQVTPRKQLQAHQIVLYYQQQENNSEVGSTHEHRQGAVPSLPLTPLLERALHRQQKHLHELNEKIMKTARYKKKLQTRYKSPPLIRTRGMLSPEVSSTLVSAMKATDVSCP